MSSIARKTDVPVWKIVYDNELTDREQLVPGQALLVVPSGRGSRRKRASVCVRICISVY